MSTNIALKSRTWCYSFDQSLRKCKGSSVLLWSTRIALYLRTEWYLPCFWWCVWNIMPTATARAGFTPCGARTCDHQREATLLLLLVVLQSVAVVAVVWAYARTKQLCLWLLGGGYTNHVEWHNSRLHSKQALTSTVSQWQTADSDKHN